MSAAASLARSRFEKLLASAGIALDGSAPHDLRVHDERLFARVLSGGSLALGESYMDGWWSCERLDEFFARVLAAGLDRSAVPAAGWLRKVSPLLFPLGRSSKAFVIGQRHYDLGNELFEAMLDRRMIYSCAYWKEAATLDEAQERKLDLVCRKAGLKAGQLVLDIGCGWGGFAGFAAERYGVSVVGITVSKEQAAAAAERLRGLPVEIRLQDYRDLSGSFDAVVSLGMFEHVGPRHHQTYFEVARRCLKEGGLFLLHTIASAETTPAPDPWILKYIFPQSHIPSLAQIASASDGLFVVEDVQNFGADYDPTLMAWHANVEGRRSSLPARYDERFFRMWRYYLLSCAGSFRARHNQLLQVVLSPRGVPGGWRPVR
ncbi:MAG: cyclopropane fatty acyl phospholipid synthase [Acidithiobacillales bacterium]